MCSYPLHFIDNFDGAKLNKLWNIRNLKGEGNYEIINSINGGLKLSTGINELDQTQIDFGDKLRYKLDSSVITSITRLGVPYGQSEAGFIGRIMEEIKQKVTSIQIGAIGTIKLNSKKSGMEHFIDTGIQIKGENLMACIELNQASAKLSINGKLSATATSNLPDTKLQPAVNIQTINPKPAYVNIRYVEAFSTT